MTAHRTVTILGEAMAVLHALDMQGGTIESTAVGGWVVTTMRREATVLSVLAQPDTTVFDPPSADVLFASDLVVIALSAATGLANQWQQVWSTLEAFQRPSIIVITDLDEARADIDEMSAIARRVFDVDDVIQVIALPALDDDDTVAGTIDLLDLTIHDASVHPPVTRAAEPEHIALLADRRSALAFTLAASHAEGALATAVNAGLTPDARSLAEAVVSCTADATFVPVLPLGSAPRFVGGAQLTDLILDVAIHTAARLPVITAIPPRATIPHSPTGDADQCAQVLCRDDARSVARLWAGSLASAHEPGGLVILDEPHPVGTVIADPPGSLSVALPAS